MLPSPDSLYITNGEALKIWPWEITHTNTDPCYVKWESIVYMRGETKPDRWGFKSSVYEEITISIEFWHNAGTRPIIHMALSDSNICKKRNLLQEEMDRIIEYAYKTLMEVLTQTEEWKDIEEDLARKANP